MKIRPEVEVFQDAGVCEKNGERCKFFIESKCVLYNLFPYMPVGGRPLKLDQCKADYLKAAREHQIEWIQNEFSLNRRCAIIMLEKSENKNLKTE